MKILKIHAVLYILVLTVIKTSLFCQPQIEIDSVIGSGGDRDAIRINYAEDNGVSVQSASGSAFYVFNADFGVDIREAFVDGVRVLSAGRDGIFVNQADGYSMHIRGSKNASTLEGHVGLIYNRNTGANADILALKVARTTNPGAGNNFITFYKGDDVPIGRIEGNGNGGVSYGSGGGDFAECLPRLDSFDVFQPGDVVGVLDGRISHSTATANQLMVITDRPAVLGNQPEDDKNYEKVSFIGQVPVRVRGAVQAGDWIVASGLEDGTGIAITRSEITLKHQIVGRAWDSSDDPGIKRVNTVVGLDHSAAKDVIIKSMQGEMLALESKMLAHQQQIIHQRIEMKKQYEINQSLQEQVDSLKHLIHTSQDSTFQP